MESQMFRLPKTAHLALVIAGLMPMILFSQTQTDDQPAEKQPVDPETQKLFDKFEKQLDGAALVGSFTTVNAESDDAEKLTKERYEIKDVKKMPNGDYWIIKTRIQYGDRDVMVPVPVEVKWAGKTPVITLNKVALPGLGTFGARVVIHDGKYAGTWSHDEVGGHLFGRIEPPAKSEATEEKAAGE